MYIYMYCTFKNPQVEVLAFNDLLFLKIFVNLCSKRDQKRKV